MMKVILVALLVSFGVANALALHEADSNDNFSRLDLDSAEKENFEKSLPLALDEDETVSKDLSLPELDFGKEENLKQPSLLHDKRAVCYDTKENCGKWKYHCRFGKWKNWMHRNCRKTCGACVRPKPKCYDRKEKCVRLKSYCNRIRTQRWMHEKCPKTCGVCTGRPVTRPTRPKVTNGIHSVQVNKDECLKAHNYYRRKHGVPPLTWDPKLDRDAQNWALHLARINDMRHAKNTGEGENLAKAWGSHGASFTCKQATNSWYSEVKDYSYSSPGFKSSTGHFTQVVWKSTKRLGVGIARNGNNIYVVARYSPPGNYRGMFPYNVKPPVGR